MTDSLASLRGTKQSHYTYHKNQFHHSSDKILSSFAHPSPFGEGGSDKVGIG